MPSQADLLKAEGNALFVNGDLEAAFAKYTEALGYDDRSAVLYSNRAACCLGLDRYLEASTDATKAAYIDPGYAKAWARFAAARMGLEDVDQAVEAWKRALSALPVENLTAAEQRQKEQYSSQLTEAKAKLEAVKATRKLPDGVIVEGNVSSLEYEKMPWKRARAMIPDLIASQKWDSSAWVIERAHTSWEEAERIMRQGHIDQTPTGRRVYVGQLGAIENLSNALMGDRRVFHMDREFMLLFLKQVQLEASSTKAWLESGPEEVMQEAPKRLEAEGWESLRPALSVTLRGWVVRAFLADSISGNAEDGLKFYNSALEVLKWGTERWKDVPDEEKGAIFEPRFARGIKGLRLSTYLGIAAKTQGTKKFPYKELLAGADDIISELAGAPIEPHIPDPAFFLSFFRYPVGAARSVRGLCLLQKARRSRRANGGALTEDITKQYQASSVEYLKAATYHPKDDERHAWFLHCAHHAQYDGGTTLKFLLLILDRLEESASMMMKIWEMSAQTALGRGGALEGDLKVRAELRRALETGKMKLDSVVVNPRPGTGP